MVRLRTTTPTTIPRAGTYGRWLLIGLMVVLFVSSAAVTVDTLWGRWSAEGIGHVGEPIALNGGSLQVDMVLPEVMAAMNHEQFARLGMTMSAMVPDSTPEGQQTLTLLVTFQAHTQGMLLDLGQFSMTADGMNPVKALRSDISDQYIPAGSSLNGAIVFRLPKGATHLQLRYGDSRAISIAVAEPEHHAEK